MIRKVRTIPEKRQAMLKPLRKIPAKNISNPPMGQTACTEVKLEKNKKKTVLMAGTARQV